ncbi:MAG: RDD family protein [Hymenobacter sp.]|nr:MAG: RDD family protein [Hymenobacter sp.]
MATIRVHTTQNVTLEYAVASIGDRIVATLLDYLVLIAWGGAWAVVIGLLASGASGGHHNIDYGNAAEVLGVAIVVLLGCIIIGPFIFYHLVCEVYFNGQSLGKKARNIRVMRLDGTAPRLGDYFLRWLLRLVEFGFGYGVIAVITIAINGKGQRLGDLAAGTTVISLKPHAAPLHSLASSLMPEGYQPVFLQAADLTDHDVGLLRQLLSRSLQHDNYVLLNETATKIKDLLHVSSDLPDEVFLRTILRDHAHIIAVG